jgi:hypothetical protein
MNKKYFLTGGILLILVIGWAFYKLNKPHMNTADQKADYTLSAADLFRSFQKDEPAANKKYLGKVIGIKGIISNIQASTGNTGILLEASPMGGVNCSFSAVGAGTFTKLKKGDSLSLKGRCTGFLMDVNLVDCVLTEQSVPE